MKKLNYFLVFTAILSLTACEMTVAAYPTNKAAMKRQITEFKYTDTGMGSGPVKVTMSDGEILQGEYTTVSSGMTQTFSQATAQGYATGSSFDSNGNSSFGTATSTASANGSSLTIGGTGGGIANLVGNKGTAMKCNYSTNSLTGSGAGTCDTSKGEQYQIHF